MYKIGDELILLEDRNAPHDILNINLKGVHCTLVEIQEPCTDGIPYRIKIQCSKNVTMYQWASEGELALREGG